MDMRPFADQPDFRYQMQKITHHQMDNALGPIE